MLELKDIDLSNTPNHIAIIMDGNGRWAKQQGEKRLFGHNVGVESVRNVLKAAKELKVKYLTLYAFSAENWNRPQEEVDGLMDLLVRTIAAEVQELNESGVCLQTIGDTDRLPTSCQAELQKAKEDTKANNDIHLILALNYSAKQEIIQAVKSIAEEVKNGAYPSDKIDPEVLRNKLYTKDIPDPELLIRTSGEQRISNFLLYQIAYSELYFTEVLWPDFTKQDLYEAVLDYQNRERRFGRVSEQLNEH